MEQTSIKRFRPHPLYILSNLWRYLFILLLPLVRAFTMWSSTAFR